MSKEQNDECPRRLFLTGNEPKEVLERWSKETLWCGIVLTTPELEKLLSEPQPEPKP